MSETPSLEIYDEWPELSGLELRHLAACDKLTVGRSDDEVDQAVDQVEALAAREVGA